MNDGYGDQMNTNLSSIAHKTSMDVRVAFQSLTLALLNQAILIQTFKQIMNSVAV